MLDPIQLMELDAKGKKFKQIVGISTQCIHKSLNWHLSGGPLTQKCKDTGSWHSVCQYFREYDLSWYEDNVPSRTEYIKQP